MVLVQVALVWQSADDWSHSSMSRNKNVYTCIYICTNRLTTKITVGISPKIQNLENLTEMF